MEGKDESFEKKGKLGKSWIFFALMMFFNLEKWRLTASKSRLAPVVLHCRWLLGGLGGLGVLRGLGGDGGEG